MGRADLSRHRGTHPSESRQTSLPYHVQSVLEGLQQDPEKRVSDATKSLLNASTQRQQQTAIKALCATIPSGRKNHAVGAVLSLIIMYPYSTSGLVSTALRACLRSGVPEEVKTELNGMYMRLGNVHEFATAVADMRVAAVLLSEREMRDAILLQKDRIERVISHICQLVEVYLNFSTGERNGQYDARLLPDVCDSSMKAAQDLLNGLHTLREHGFDVASVVASCKRVLGMEFVPRSCALACGVAYVTGRVLCAPDGSPETLVDVTTEILCQVSMFPPFSQLALLRAVMEAPAARPALADILFPSHDRSKSIFDSLTSIVTANSDVHLRFLAMDTLIACIRRAKPLSLRCRDAVLGLIYERWQEPFPGVASQIRHTMEALVATDRGDEDTAFWMDITGRLAGGDWKVKGMHAPLGVLVKRVGARALLNVKEDCQQLALAAIAADYRLVKHSVDWLGNFWKTLRKEVTFDEFLRITGGTLVEGLISPTDRILRERIAEHALPVYIRSVHRGEVGECANGLLTHLASMKSSSQEARARGTVSILSVARKNGVFVASFTDPDIFKLLQAALACAEEDVRSSALDLIVTCQVPTEPVLEQELDLVLGYLPVALMPGGSLADRSRFRHSMRRLFERLAACRHAARDGSAGWWMRVRKDRFGGQRTQEFEDMKVSLLKRIDRFEARALSVLLASCYPGAAFARRSSALEVLELQLKNMGFRANEAKKSDSLVAGVLACLTDEWERPRRAALEVISTFVAPIPGLGDYEKVVPIQKFAISLLHSPKQNDVDAGASLLRTVFRKYVLLDSMTPEVLPIPLLVGEFSPKALVPFEFDDILKGRNSLCGDYFAIAERRGLIYAKSTLTLLKNMVEKANANFTEACERGLFHGPFLLLRYMFQDIPWKSIRSGTTHSAFTAFIKEIVDVAWRCTEMAMRGVSFKAFEEFKAEASGLEGEENLTEDEDILLREKHQLESTSCFQSLKEICIALGILSHGLPLGASEEDNGELVVLSGQKPIHIEEKQVLNIGNLFLHVFRNTRHWGVLDGASEGFQLLCESLLRTSSGNLRTLPRNWSRETVDLALNEGLYVLRRSAGVPAVINAIVNAEGNCNRRSYESPILHETCSRLLDHLESSAMFTDEDILGKQRSRAEESVAHSLNLLRSLFLNGNVATTILRHLERAAICCLKAFRSASWLIRNSAMILFSALVRRGIGVCTEGKVEHAASSFDVVGGTSAILDEEQRLRGNTAFQFFSRHPKLHPFLLKTLQESTKPLESGVLNDHASLFPTLYLLSCLSPAATEDPSTSISMKAFRSIVRRCTHWRTDYVRRVAAAAYVPILDDPSHVAKTVEEILSEVPTEPGTVSPVVGRGSPKISENEVVKADISSMAEGAYQFHQNILHGDLLTVAAILNRMKAIMSQNDMCDTVRVLSRLLPSRVWIAANGKKNPCSYTRAAMVTVVSVTYVLAREVKNVQSHSIPLVEANALLSLCDQLASKLNDISESECGFGALVGMTCLRRRAAEFLVTKSMAEVDENQDGFITSLKSHLRQMQSTSRDIVLCGIEGCLAIISTQSQARKQTEPSQEMRKAIHDIIRSLWQCSVEILQNRDDHELHVVTLRLQIALLGIADVTPGTESSDICNLTNADIVRITDWAKSHSCVDIREYALILLGKLISVGVCPREVAPAWMDASDAACMSQTTTTRMAACTTVALSGLSQATHRSNTDRDIAARALLVFARMLEDDHSDVRKLALRNVREHVSPSMLTEDMSLNVLPSLIVIYTLLVADFSDCESAFAILSESLDRPIHKSLEKDLLMQAMALIAGCKAHVVVTQKRVIGSPAEVGRDDQRRDSSRLFRLEDEVDEGEPVLRLQLVTYCFRDVILSRKRDLPDSKFLQEMFEQLMSDLKEELSERVKKTGAPIICGSSFTKEGFLQCLKMMLRLFLGICCLHAANVLQDMADRFNDTAKNFRAEMEKSCYLLHPVLFGVLEGLCTVLEKGCSEHAIRSTPAILFLLAS